MARYEYVICNDCVYYHSGCPNDGYAPADDYCPDHESEEFWQRCPKAEIYGRLVSCARGVSKIEHAWMMCLDCPYKPEVM